MLVNSLYVMLDYISLTRMYLDWNYSFYLMCYRMGSLPSILFPIVETLHSKLRSKT